MMIQENLVNALQAANADKDKLIAELIEHGFTQNKKIAALVKEIARLKGLESEKPSAANLEKLADACEEMGY